jgi:hypothetical protein
MTLPPDPSLIVTEGDHLSPMPTPHSRRGRRHGPRVWFVTLVLLLGPLLVLELVVRGLIAIDRLPTAASNNPQLDVNLIQVGGRPPQDILLVGDSQIATGLDPTLLGRLVADRVGRDISAYNFGQPGSTPDDNRLALGRLTEEGLLPKVIVLDISMSSLSAFGGGDTGFAGAEDVNVARGDRPTLADSALGRELLGCGVETEIIDRLDCEFASLSAAWRWHGRPQAVLRAALYGARLDAKAERGQLRKDGLFARHAAAPRQIQNQIAKGDYSAARIQPQFNPAEAARFERFAAWAEEHGVEVIYVAWPTTRPYTEELLSRNPEWEAQRRAATERLAEAIGQPVVYIESYGEDWWTDDSASDLNHLSAEGAKAFTRQLWNDPAFRSALLEALGEEALPGSPDPAASPVPGSASTPLATAAPSPAT